MFLLPLSRVRDIVKWPNSRSHCGCELGSGDFVIWGERGILIRWKLVFPPERGKEQPQRVVVPLTLMMLGSPILVHEKRRDRKIQDTMEEVGIPGSFRASP
jgi:hypothetical protein